MKLTKLSCKNCEVAKRDSDFYLQLIGKSIVEIANIYNGIHCPRCGASSLSIFVHAGEFEVVEADT